MKHDEKTPYTDCATNRSTRAWKVYLLLFLICKKVFLLKLRGEKISIGSTSIYDLRVNGRMRFALWNFTIWTFFQERISEIT
jgi:hypothetical protein